MRLRDHLRDVPVLGWVLRRLKALLARATFPGSAEYWEARYARGGTSGPGSYGELAAFKARFLNTFVAEHGIRSVVEFGCGDGHQLALASYPSYVGLDVSPTAVRRCATRFSDDHTKSFFVYDPDAFVDRHGLFRAELALSLDVVFHLVEEDVFATHLEHLFASAERYVIIYGRDTDTRPATVGYVRDRRFTLYITEHLSGWRLVDRVPNEHPWTGDPATGSDCEFFVYAPEATRRHRDSATVDSRPGDGAT